MMRSLCLILLLAAATFGARELPANYVAGSLIRLNDNGAWSWFMDERAIVHGGKLIVGSDLRPIIPKWKDPRTALVWMRGAYVHNRGEWNTAVVGMILPPR